jgi:hypothetical protein
VAEEKFLARTEKFTDTEVLKLETDEFSRREMAMAHAAANGAFHSERLKLMEKQHKEYELFVATRKHWREVVIGEQKKEQAVLE